MPAPPAYPLTVFYDASCPLCATEMETLKARDAGNVLRLVDCSAPAFDERAYADAGVTRAMMMERIHARDADGRWLRGVAVFGAVYRAAGLAAVATVCESALLQPLLDRAYPWVARNRYRLSRFGPVRVFQRLAGDEISATSAACPACARTEPPPHAGARDDARN